MRSFYIVATLALASAAAVAAPAFAGGSDLAFTLPIGFSTGGEHKGLETLTNTATTTTKGVGAGDTTRLPGGWDQGKADLKAPFHGEHKGLETLTNTATTTTTRLPGGWDQGKADLKAPFHDSNTASPTSSTGHRHH